MVRKRERRYWLRYTGWATTMDCRVRAAVVPIKSTKKRNKYFTIYWSSFVIVAIWPVWDQGSQVPNPAYPTTKNRSCSNATPVFFLSVRRTNQPCFLFSFLPPLAYLQTNKMAKHWIVLLTEFSLANVLQATRSDRCVFRNRFRLWERRFWNFEWADKTKLCYCWNGV